jgi:hypothetical protein
LWREVKLCRAQKGPYYMSIDLKERCGEDERRSNAESSKLIELLMRMGGQTATVEIAYSPLQVNWARLTAFGGMHPNDPRIEKKKLAAGNSAAQSLRTHRCFITLDATPFLSGQKTSPAGSENPDIIYSPPEKKLAGQPIFNNGSAVGPKGGVQGLHDINGWTPQADGVVDNTAPTVLLEHPLIFIERAISDIHFINAEPNSAAKTALLHQLQKALSDLLYDKGPSKIPVLEGMGDLLCDYNYDLSKAYTLLKNCLSALYINCDPQNASPFFSDLLSGAHPLSSSFFPTDNDMQKAQSQYNTSEALFKVKPHVFRKIDQGSNNFFLENFLYCANEGWRAGRFVSNLSYFGVLFKQLKLEDSLATPLKNLYTLAGMDSDSLTDFLRK